MARTPFQQEPMAVVGFACRLPGGNHSPQKLWEFLERGEIASNQVPKTRFNLDAHFDGSSKPGTMRLPGGMFLGDIDPADFDASFFGIGRTEAIAMDPNQRQMLEVVFEGLENAGIPLERISGTPVGCFVGSFASDYGDMQNRDAEDRPTNCVIGIGRSIMANRISYFLNAKGPSLTIDTACSGSLVCLDLACRSLQSGEINAAIVASSNFFLNPDHAMDPGLVGQAYSPSAMCHTFDASADGYVKAEAVSCIIIRKLSDALRDRDPIRAIIRGSASNHNGRTAGIASPSWEAQAAAIRAAYANAGLTNFNDTSYLECHGTGTKAGDYNEVEGAGSVFAQTRDPDKPLIIGSIKSNIGHAEPAAASSGLIKLVMAMEKGVIPGTPSFINPNPDIDFAANKVKASRRAIIWPDSDYPLRRASINSFGFGGSNAHAIVDQPDVAARGYYTSSYRAVGYEEDDFFDEDSERPYVCVLSANDATSLKANIQKMCAHLINPQVKVNLTDLAYTLSEHRTRLPHRAFITTQSTEVEEKDFVSGRKQGGQQAKIAMVFTGQGAQWPQMGKAMLEVFPWTRSILEELDQVLQAKPDPPEWSIVAEIAERRSAEHMRQPELSQTLVIALQLCLVAILESWGIKPSSVVGHSSGEIVAAYTAGLLDRASAITAAFYRGKAAKNRETEVATDVGMLAVGVGAEAATAFLENHRGSAWIACFNSPSSVTISGRISTLEALHDEIKAAGHFARMLLVDLAYHSPMMDVIGEEYLQLLNGDEKFRPTGLPSDVAMYSSATASKMDAQADSLYWKINMVNPVRFNEALTELMQNESPNILIEIGPSGALAGPISQTLQTLPGSKTAQYYPSWSRGANAAKSLLDVSGHLFVAGAPIDMCRVNAYDMDSVRTIVDLPNYNWNHSVKYWHENAASKEWRFKKFVTHELLGSKVPSTLWSAPTWRKRLHLEDVPWLSDHHMGSDILLPGTGYITLALEAMYQTYCALHPDEDIGAPNELAYRFRNVKFERAMVVEEEKPTMVIFNLAELSKNSDWYRFKVQTESAGVIYDHCSGMVRVQDPIGDDENLTASQLAPLKHPQPTRPWYQLQRDAGIDFGPTFQKLRKIESVSGSRSCRAIVSLEPPPSIWDPATYYPLHPAVLDACFQVATPANCGGERSAVKDIMLPAFIDDMVINKMPRDLHDGLGIARSEYTGRGRKEVAKSWAAHVAIHDPETGRLITRVKGLNYVRLDVDDKPDLHVFCAGTWKPDVTLLTRDELTDLLHLDSDTARIANAVDLIAHHKPALKILEINLDNADTSSIWFQGSDNAARAAYTQYDFTSTDSQTVVAVQEGHESKGNAEFHHLTSTKNAADAFAERGPYDLAIVKAPLSLDIQPEDVVKDLDPLLERDSFVLFMRQEDYIESVHEPSSLNGTTDTAHLNRDAETDSEITAPSHNASLATETTHESSLHGNAHIRLNGDTPTSGLNGNAYSSHLNGHAETSKPVHDTALHNGDASAPLNKHAQTDSKIPSPVKMTSSEKDFSSGPDSPASVQIEESYSLSQIDVGLDKLPAFLFRKAKKLDPTVVYGSLEIARFDAAAPSLTSTLQNRLEASGWSISVNTVEGVATESSHKTKSTVLVLDELSNPVLRRISEKQWEFLQQLISSGRPLLWVTKGAATLNVTDPDRAMAQGLFRTVRMERPDAKVTVLDVQSETESATDLAVERVLYKLQNDANVETEYAERNGVLFTQRIMPDTAINSFKAAERGKGLEPVVQNLHETHAHVRLQAERVGTLDSLTWCEIDDGSSPVEPGMVEIEVIAVGVNFKDVATTMGLVPENEYMIGCECTGYVKRVASDVTNFKVGERVVAMRNGTYANRVQCPADRVHVIPASMSFNDAATIPLVYLTAIYSLYHLANLREGQTVLIHSAAGGVGLAAIQLARYKKAEIFVTVGTDEKREFLANTFGIPHDHMSNSRNAGFAKEIRLATNGRGVDVVLNSLTGDLLDESWRLLADGGTMVEIGKRDIVDRNTLAMDPFDRNCSFRAVDLSYVREITDALIGKHLKEIFSLVNGGHLKPIHPIRTFTFDQVIPALSYMRRGQHMGKIVVSREDNKDVQVPIRPAVRKLRLRADASYLIVGGLKGLCGSVAIHLARHGARHIIVMSRSGVNDEASAKIIEDCAAYQCKVSEARGDVGDKDFVHHVFRSSHPKRIAGVIQGAMVIRDKPFEMMTQEEFHAAAHAKTEGTWNLHYAAQQELDQPLDFFTLLSSVSGVVGNKAQANYAAANTFLDAFASYRRSMGLAAHSVDLGAVEEVGYIAEQGNGLEARFDMRQFTPINEGMLRKIMSYSILQQDARGPLSDSSSGQLITGLAYPLAAKESDLAVEQRFAYLFNSRIHGGADADGDAESSDVDQAIKAFRKTIASKADTETLVEASLPPLQSQITKLLRLETEIEPDKPLMLYGVDSLSAVELRGWVRQKLAVELSTLDITNASSLVALGERLVAKLPQAEDAEKQTEEA